MCGCPCALSSVREADGPLSLALALPVKMEVGRASVWGPAQAVSLGGRVAACMCSGAEAWVRPSGLGFRTGLLGPAQP